MRLAENSVPKMTRQEYGGGEPKFLSVKEGVYEILSSAAGKVLLLSDEEAMFAEQANSPRALSVIFDGDCLPLFLMPDGVSHVVGGGGSDAMRAARYFSEVRGIPCTLFPSQTSLDGVFEADGEIVLGETKLSVPLADGQVIWDEERLAPSLKRGYARLLLGTLADFEARVLCEFSLEAEPCGGEAPKELSLREVLLKNAARRQRERAGGYAGEGVVLAGRLEGETPEWTAYVQLTSLYAAFFEKGKPRRYFTPDYRARAKRAGVSLARAPSAEEYALRAMTLERIRAPFAREALALVAGREEYREIFPKASTLLRQLQSLPEHAPNGLSAVIRDFGLMEWENDEGRATQTGGGVSA